LKDTTLLLVGISNFEWKGVKNLVNCSFYYSSVPSKLATLPAVNAQTVDQNIGRPLQKILSYGCSTTLVFKVLRVSIEIFELQSVKHG
jgi:hypothetical protein